MGRILSSFTEPAAAMASTEPPIFVISTAAQLPQISTCLKWSADGELSAFDLRFVLSRLARVDRHVAAIWGNILDLEPCPSIS